VSVDGIRGGIRPKTLFVGEEEVYWIRLLHRQIIFSSKSNITIKLGNF